MESAQIAKRQCKGRCVSASVDWRRLVSEKARCASKVSEICGVRAGRVELTMKTVRVELVMKMVEEK